MEVAPKVVSLGTRRLKKINEYTSYLAVPKIVRQNLGVKAGDYVEFLFIEGRCEIKKVAGSQSVTDTNLSGGETEK